LADLTIELIDLAFDLLAELVALVEELGGAVGQLPFPGG
jgi:hypothetical protein